jgi:hypothetical protein
VLEKIFTWWNGATLGALNTIKKRAVLVGEDDFGNRYYEAKDARDSYDGRLRRWVIYKGYAEASTVPAEWHGWLHLRRAADQGAAAGAALGKAPPAQSHRHPLCPPSGRLDRSHWRTRPRRGRLPTLVAGVIRG